MQAQLITPSITYQILHLLRILEPNWDKLFAFGSRGSNQVQSSSLAPPKSSVRRESSHVDPLSQLDPYNVFIPPQEVRYELETLLYIFHFNFARFSFSFISTYIHTTHSFYSTYMKFNTLSNYNKQVSKLIITFTIYTRHI